MSHPQSPAHRRLCVSLVGYELEDKGSAENPEHQRPCSGPPLLHLYDNVEEMETETGGQKERRVVMKCLNNKTFPDISDYRISVQPNRILLMITSRWQ